LKTMMIAKWTEELGLNEAGITMLEDEDIDWNEQQAATIRQGIMRMFTCC
jgi:hypothetical protein